MVSEDSAITRMLKTMLVLEEHRGDRCDDEYEALNDLLIWQARRTVNAVQDNQDLRLKIVAQIGVVAVHRSKAERAEQANADLRQELAALRTRYETHIGQRDAEILAVGSALQHAVDNRHFDRTDAALPAGLNQAWSAFDAMAQALGFVEKITGPAVREPFRETVEVNGE
jgi:hypothetical protein